MPDKLLNTQQTLRRLGISRTTLYKLMDKGAIKPVTPKLAALSKRSHLLFRESDVDALLPQSSDETAKEEPPAA